MPQFFSYNELFFHAHPRKKKLKVIQNYLTNPSINFLDLLHLCPVTLHPFWTKETDNQAKNKHGALINFRLRENLFYFKAKRICTAISPPKPDPSNSSQRLPAIANLPFQLVYLFNYTLT